MSDEIDQLTTEQLRERLRRAEDLVDILLNRNPDGIIIQNPDGSIVVNPAGIAITTPGAAPDTSSLDAATVGSEIGLFREDGVTPMGMEESGLVRAMQGEEVRNEIIFMRSSQKPEGIFLETTAAPLGGKGAISIFRDVTSRKKLEDDLARGNAELAARVEENQRLVERLRLALDDLSTPVLELWDDVLALPIVGIIDTQRSVQMSERLLKAVLERRSRYVIIDLTGVEIVDTSTADRLLKMARAVALLGAECVLTGIQPNVAQTLTELGVEFAGFKTQRNLKRALDMYLARSAAADA
jgi:rsbT co-antagonist protein RsbR